MDIDALKKQQADFEKEYGELPLLPIRVRYKWCHTRAEGDLKMTRFNTYALFGFPGIVGPADEEVSELVFLYDGKNRPFPNVELHQEGQIIVAEREPE